MEWRTPAHSKIERPPFHPPAPATFHNQTPSLCLVAVGPNSAAALFTFMFIGLLGFSVSCLLAPLAIRAGTMLRLVAQPSSDRWHRNPTPLSGSFAIAGGLVTALIVGGAVRDSTSLAMLALFAAAFVLGLVDDFRTLRPNVKLYFELIIVACAVAVGPHLWLTPWRAANQAITGFWLLTAMNGFNLIDGLDGLAGGVGSIAACGIALISILNGNSAFAHWGLALAGALAGFLVFNWSPAQVFMGDAGSLSVGLLLGMLSIGAGDFAAATALSRICVPALLLLVPLLDTTTVTATRIARGQPVSRRGLDHTHHRLARLGLGDRCVASALYVLQAGAAGSAVALSYAPEEISALLIPFVVLPFGLIAMFLIDRSFDADEPGAIQDLPLIARVMLSLAYKRRLVEAVLDAIMVAAAYFGAFVLRHDFRLEGLPLHEMTHSLPIAIAASLAAFAATRVYRGIWRFTSIEDALRFAQASALSAIVVFLLARIVTNAFTISTAAIFAMLVFNLLGLSRASFQVMRWIARALGQSAPRVVVVGADAAAEEAVHHLLHEPPNHATVLGYIDEDGFKHGKYIRGYEVLGSIREIGRIYRERPFQELLIASHSFDGNALFSLRGFAREHGIVVRRFVQGVTEIRPDDSGTVPSA